MLDSKKIELGQFFTKGSEWLKPQVKEFIKSSKCQIAYDPFAGAGHLLHISNEYGIEQVIGLDIDESLEWEINDSLYEIPHIEDAIIITNPPYLAKQSATRKKMDLSKYFDRTSYDDLYLIALEKMVKAQKYVVAIIPESFINSSFKDKNLLHSITILEENPFTDTDAPVCVVCFDGIYKEYDKIRVYKNGVFENDLQTLENFRITPKNNVAISFNDLSGWLGIRAVDSTDDKTFIKFDFKENIDYDWQNKIKVSSRHFTLVEIDLFDHQKQLFIDNCNKILKDIRNNSADAILTPFMGNTKSGIRRRRLDFKLARGIMEKAYFNLEQNFKKEIKVQKINIYDLMEENNCG